ncbi:phosphoglucosamine mutase [Helicobacter sp. 11S02629-2]|uniref:phosphoglucosamine mutase n=1 Tax=Helicobacter sp. 11S02629-2 TaxID=1476195 RepID=UPI000BA70EEA|nr:phosphoglucosamine mutase [Helicobacter sp. 11S02629-2]PAF44355.1 phosphoglucosamine mutase [Helicobacter sp. 11S02629-2]
MKIFGTDGVRGKAGRDINALSVLKLGMAAGVYFQQTSKSTNKLIVGKDTRKSGYMIENALVSGLTAVGFDVIQTGPIPTPAISFLTQDLRCDAGIMISASHNPFEDNGIKFFNSNGFKLDEDKEAKIEEIYHSELLKYSKTDKEIGYSKRIDDVVGRYVVHIKNSFPKHLTLQGLRIVVDCANGAAYKVAPLVFSELGADVVVINDHPNGYNINESCGAMHPYELSQKVRYLRADIGFGLDGDADRLVVVDDLGNIVHGDKLIGALGAYLKSKSLLRNDAIVATIMSNLALKDFLKTHNIDVVSSNVGDKYVLQAMKEDGLNFGGEQSGHVIFSDFSQSGDGLICALQVMAMVLDSKKKAHVVLNPFSLYPQILKNIPVSKKVPLEKIEGLSKKLSEIESKDIRHLIRYSGTESKLRILLEGKDDALLHSYMEDLEDFFAKTLS